MLHVLKLVKHLRINKFEKLIKVDKVHLLWRYTGYILLIFLIILSAFLSIALPIFNLPPPTGKYTIGTQTFHFVDSTRAETFTDDPDDKRELMVQVWYPAEAPKANKDYLFMMNDQSFTAITTQFANSLGIPGFTLKYWKYIGANSYSEAQILRTDAPYPVILMSHGLGTMRMLHTSQAENLASHGYIVLAMDHTYSSAATLFPDNKVTSFLTPLSEDHFQEDAMKLGEVWIEDIKYMVQQIKRINSGDVKGAKQFKQLLNLNKVGIMGHSFGGAVAFEAIHLIPELRSGINMDGTLINTNRKNEENKPFLFMVSDFLAISSFELAKNTNIPKDALENLKRERKVIVDTIQKGGYAVNIKGAEHYNYTDLQLFSRLLSYTGMTGKIDGKRSSEIVNELIIRFFDQTLKSQSSQHKSLRDKVSFPLSNITKTYPEIEFISSVGK
ncbi:dienelactone hydrolase [Paenibacillus turicensis]|uniref:Dienelactone hydrolase n=1 Tax=Paenibacillus turicensis TaxID=160487 RepID=A0ABS4FN56_9BACL|nr:dienelactone hydrolase family protein [Paenibacillus turicensis]MBP1904005.1 dienelactone hydrolase [Paenibacillus turicensis]